MSKKEKLSIIIPCYNEQEMIDLCHKSVCAVIDPLTDFDAEIVYINDGSKDNTYEKLLEIQKKDKRAIIINLSRNFGKEAAMTAGINNAQGDAVIILDADLQDPPDLIPELIKLWKENDADVVYGQRVKREGETWLKKLTARFFYKLMSYISSTEIPLNTGDFRLMNRRAVDALNQLKERHRFLKGMFAWVGYKQIPLEYNRAPRAAGNTKWNYFKLLDFALEGITGFSIIPLRIASFCGFLISLFAFAFGGFIILKTIFLGTDMPGYASLMVMITFLSGIQLLCIGILGEYIGRIFGETKNRPLYFIENIHGR
ncbi:MAG: glycosyltransferase family 2 protein [Alphaproteobacteria bacterium]|nr:glycosyltransferase family 2 protein [Alphaproteobacteria bacterium]